MRRIELDQVGAAASFACAIHCAALPIAISLSAAGVASFLDSRPLEWGLCIVAASVGTASAWRGWRRHGNRTVAVVLATAALGLLLMTALRPEPAGDELLLRLSRPPQMSDRLLQWSFPVMGLVIAVAHVVNLKLCRSCRGCDETTAAAPVERPPDDCCGGR
jgi:hypothetical protein